MAFENTGWKGLSRRRRDFRPAGFPRRREGAAARLHVVAREAQAAALPANESGPVRGTAPSREEQVAAAIARITGNPPAPVARGGGDDIAIVTAIAGSRTP